MNLDIESIIDIIDVLEWVSIAPRVISRFQNCEFAVQFSIRKSECSIDAHAQYGWSIWLVIVEVLKVDSIPHRDERWSKNLQPPECFLNPLSKSKQAHCFNSHYPESNHPTNRPLPASSSTHTPIDPSILLTRNQTILVKRHQTLSGNLVNPLNLVTNAIHLIRLCFYIRM